MTIKLDHNKVIFSRRFNAAIERVFDAYTKRELFEQWFHPKGASTEVYRFNAEDNGEAFFAIKAPTMTSYTLTQYQKVKRPTYIEYTDSFATPQGQRDTSMPSMQVIIKFTALSNQQTEVTSTSVFPTKDAAKQAIDMGVEQGMNSTLDNLEKLLNS